MSPLPLERYELFRSTDLKDVREKVGRVFVPHRLELVGNSTSLDARMHTRRLIRVSANYVSYGGEVDIEAGELTSFYAVYLPLAGHATISCGSQVILAGADHAAVVSPTGSLSMRWSADCAMLVLRVERSALEAHLRELIDSPLNSPLRFAIGMDVTTGFGYSWASTLRTLVVELDRGDDSFVSNRMAAESLEQVLLTGLLVSQRNNYSGLLADRTHAGNGSRAVTMVRELIENHPEWRHTVRSLAQEANISVRALQQGFAKHLGVSPLRYLLNVRMQRARDDLRAAHRDVVTVGQIAEKWGLGHPGRFAGEYRKRYGELPSETLAK